MKITVILCTYNRCRSLERALKSVGASTLPESAEWEVLVVDNNSSDQTRETVEEFCRQDPGRFRYLFEPQPGKSHALNRGISAARGEILAFMDDDVRVETTWLKNLTASLHEDGWVGSGGPIRPERVFSLPRWLRFEGRSSMAPLAMVELGDAPGKLAEPPFGTNMAFRKEMFDRYGGFRTDLGPRPDSEIRSEDTEFGQRLLAAGERLWYEPSAVVYHSVPENRLKKEYFLAWWFAKGRANIREFGARPNAKYHIRGIPLYLCRNLAVWTVRWMISVEPRRRFERKLTIWEKAGEIVECYHLSLKAKAQQECNARM
jgi:glycosyltransferase involved in cell wall biosynthesis